MKKHLVANTKCKSAEYLRDTGTILPQDVQHQLCYTPLLQITCLWNYIHQITADAGSQLCPQIRSQRYTTKTSQSAQQPAFCLDQTACWSPGGDKKQLLIRVLMSVSCFRLGLKGRTVFLTTHLESVRFLFSL